MLKIFSNLDLKDLGRCAMVSKTFCELSHHSMFILFKDNSIDEDEPEEDLKSCKLDMCLLKNRCGSQYMLKKFRGASSNVVGKSTPLIGIGLADMLKILDATGTLGTPGSAGPDVPVPTYASNKEFRPLIRKWDRQEHLDKLNPEDTQMKKLFQVLNDLRL